LGFERSGGLVAGVSVSYASRDEAGDDGDRD
jgi:hypothetical protein